MKTLRKARLWSIIWIVALVCAFYAPTAFSQGTTKIPVRPSTQQPLPVMKRVETSHDASTLTVYTEFVPMDWYFHRVFLDTDTNPATGFSVGRIQNGAEFLVEGAFLYRYTGTGRNWSWQQISSVPFDLGARYVRWRIDRALIGDSATPNVTGLRVHLQTFAGAEAHSGLYLHQYLAQLSPTAQQLGIPAYIWSGDTAIWQRLLASDPATLDMLIFGVANGPWTQPVPQLVGHLTTARQQGRRVLGYVYTKMGSRNLTEVLDDIDRYYDWYPVNGIFVDEGDFTCAHLDYYSEIRAHVMRKGADQRVVVNPGRVFEECMMTTADIFMSFETRASDYLSTPTAWILPPFADKYPRWRFWHVAHGATPSQLSAIVARSKQLHVGRLWVTPDELPNPYDSFPDANFYADLVRLATEQPSAAASVRPAVTPLKSDRAPQRLQNSRRIKRSGE